MQGPHGRAPKPAADAVMLAVINASRSKVRDAEVASQRERCRYELTLDLGRDDCDKLLLRGVGTKTP